MRERERERETETETETDRDRDRETDRHTDRQTEFGLLPWFLKQIIKSSPMWALSRLSEFAGFLHSAVQYSTQPTLRRVVSLNCGSQSLTSVITLLATLTQG